MRGNQQPITRDAVAAAQQQAAAIIGERIESMTADEVKRIARGFLPSMGLKPSPSKKVNKAAMTDAKINLMASADEVGAVLPAEVVRALQADMEGRVDEARPVASAEQQADQAQEVTLQPQDFIPAPDGGLDYGEITPEMGKAMRRQAGKIRLQHGVQNSNGTGWGLVHIEANHGKQISGLGFGSVQDFVAHVASNIQQVWQVPGNSQLLLTLKDGRKDVMYIQLEIAKEGDFYRVNSAFPVRQEDYESLKGMKKIWDWSEPTSAVTGQRPAFATAASASPESESSQGSSNARGQDASVPPTAPAAQPDTPKLTQDEAKSLMAWEDLGQKNGVKTHALTFYESQANKDAKRGRMIVARVTKEVDSGNWTVEGSLEDKSHKFAWDNMTYALQDKLIDTKRVVQAIQDAGRELKDQTDVYLQEELYHARVSHKSQGFVQQELTPMVKALADKGIDLPDFETSLHARHAPEANRVMKQRNPNEAEIEAKKKVVYAQLQALGSMLRDEGATTKEKARVQRLFNQMAGKLELLAQVKPWTGSEEDRQKLSGMSDDEAATIMAGLMHDATLAQIAPSKPYVYGNDKARYMMLQGRLKLLGDDAKTVYRETRDAYRGHRHQGATLLLMKESG